MTAGDNSEIVCLRAHWDPSDTKGRRRCVGLGETIEAVAALHVSAIHCPGTSCEWPFVNRSIFKTLRLRSGSMRAFDYIVHQPK